MGFRLDRHIDYVLSLTYPEYASVVNEVITTVVKPQIKPSVLTRDS